MIPLTRAIPERIRGGCDDALYKSTFTLLDFTTPSGNNWYEPRVVTLDAGKVTVGIAESNDSLLLDL